MSKESAQPEEVTEEITDINEMTDVSAIRQKLEENIDQEIVVIVEMGRRRQKERRGILKEIYRSLFVVELDQDENNFERASYGYRDILTKAIAVKFVDELEDEEGTEE